MNGIINMTFLLNRMRGWVVGSFGTKTRVLAAAAAGLAVVAVAGMYKRHKLNERVKEHQSRLKQEQEAAFENRHLKEYDEMADDPNAPVPPSHAHVRETTPQGDVIMTYDADRATFCYYCDKRSVQFKYLEPVARKYVVEHGCKRLYIDLRQATATQATATQATATQATATQATKELMTNGGKTEAPEKPEAIKTVFAQFKKYGTTPTTTQRVQKEQVTRYWYCGNMNEYNAHSAAGDANSAHDFSIIKPIDYASYKKMSSGS